MNDVKKFYDKHCVSRTYFFQVFKCDDTTCEFHKPIRGPSKISIFPDPEPFEEDGLMRYRPGSDPEEKYVPSKLVDPEKRSHNIPFSLSAQTSKNVGFVIKCEECQKSRLLHSQKKLKGGDIQVLKRIISKFSYECGSLLSEYLGTGGELNREKEVSTKVYVRENLLCVSKIGLPYYSVEFYKKICVYCGISGTSRVLGNSI